MPPNTRQLISELRKLFNDEKFISHCDFDAVLPRATNNSIWQRIIIKYFVFQRSRHNRKILIRAERRGLTCAGCKLDNQQVEAVVACEDAQLVLASAGSGKTLSLLAKIEYLHNVLHIPAEHILAISFTKKTVSELIERCAIKNVDFRTFHGLGNNILHNIESDLGAKKLISEDQISDFFKNKITELCSVDSAFARNINDYLLFYFSAPQNPGVFDDFKSRINFHRQYLRKALKDELSLSQNQHHKSSTLSGDFIRSKEEQLIAN